MITFLVAGIAVVVGGLGIWGVRGVRKKVKKTEFV